MPGHVHVVAGDITKIGCDAWLLPTDGAFTISGAFAEEIGLVSGQRLANHVWDGSRVIRLEQSLAGRPQVWLANVGRNPGDPRNEGSWYADVIKPFARSATKGLKPTGVPPLLAIPVLGTGDGGMAADKGTIYRELLPEMLCVAESQEVDLVLTRYFDRAELGVVEADSALVRLRGGLFLPGDAFPSGTDSTMHRVMLDLIWRY